MRNITKLLRLANLKVDLTAKHVLITVANRGIGLGLAEGFLEAGATVTIVAL